MSAYAETGSISFVGYQISIQRMKGVVAKLQPSPIKLIRATNWPELPLMNHQHADIIMRDGLKSSQTTFTRQKHFQMVPLANGGSTSILWCRRASM